jgi:SecD/SecF fusion protein
VHVEHFGGFSVTVNVRGDGGGQWAALTGDAACAPPGSPERRVGIVLDKHVISSPQIDPSVRCDVGIVGGSTVITGQFTQGEAAELAVPAH